MSEFSRASEVLGDMTKASIVANIIFNAIRALIATHPNPEAVRKVFDQLDAQVQVSVSLTAAPVSEDGRAFAKGIIAAVFQPPVLL